MSGISKPGAFLGKNSALFSVSYGFFSKISQLQKWKSLLLHTSLKIVLMLIWKPIGLKGDTSTSTVSLNILCENCLYCKNDPSTSIGVI